jgi:hypothetical protein
MASASRRVLVKIAARGALGAAVLRPVAGSAQDAGSADATPEGGCMAILHIHLQEGFANDQVVVMVGERTVFDAEVTTNLMRGRAAAFEAPVPPGMVTVEVRIPSRDLRDSVDIDAEETPYLGCGLRGEVIQFRPTERPTPSI